MFTNLRTPARRTIPVVLLAGLSSALAQSSVTIFGVIDVNVRAVKNNATVKTVSNDGIGASALGFRGTEDLGGGLRAEFWIEGQLTADNGGPTPFAWRRRATVALAGSFGEVRLGRDYTPTYWNLAQYEPWRGLGVGNANNLEPIAIPRPPLGSATGTLVRADNSVVYLTPAGLAPWQVHLIVPVGVGEIRASWQRADQSGAGTDPDDATQLALGYVRYLSKRTALYATASKVGNQGKQVFAASSSGGPLSPGNDSTGIETGVRHTF